MLTETRLKKILDLKGLRLPARPKVRKILAEPYEEQSRSPGDDRSEALRVTVLLDESTSDDDRSWKAVEPIDQAIRAAIGKADADLFPYIDFLKKSELNE